MVSYLTQWTPKGSVISHILVDFLNNLDHIWVFNHTARQNPLFSFDGHISQFKQLFLRYIVNRVHAWVVYIGVPYGISLWQV